MTSLKCPNCDADLPLEGGDDEWCEACGKKLPVHIVAAIHAELKRRRHAHDHPIELPPGDDEPEVPTTGQQQPAKPKATGWFSQLFRRAR
jgi:hypothetical protein